MSRNTSRSRRASRGARRAVTVAMTAGLALAAGSARAQETEPVAPPEPVEKPAAATPAAPAPAEQPGPMALFRAFTRAQLASAGFARREAEIAGQRTVWWEKGDGPALVLVHGVADQAGTWFQVAPALAADHRVLLVDLPGHGESGPESGPLPMSTVMAGFEEWLAAHTAAEGEPAPVLIGNSMGAWVSLLAAHRHPDLVSRVVAVNGGPLRPDTGGLDLLPDDREEARRLMAALRDPGSAPIPDPVLDDLVRRAPTGQTARMFQANDDLESHLMEGRLGEISTPVDLLWGRSDRYLGDDFPERLLAGLPRARFTAVEQCGHLPQAECPERFLESLRAVLAMEPPGAAAEPAATEPAPTEPAAPTAPSEPSEAYSHSR